MARAVDWDSRISGWLEQAPLCKCGCGRQVLVNVDKARKDRLKTYSYREYIPGHNFRQVPSLQLTARERSVICGSLLGDAWCGFAHKKATMPRMVMNHGIKQLPYVQWKAKELERLNAKVSCLPNPGWGDTWARLVTASHESLLEFHNVFYPDGTKKVSSKVCEQIDPLALAVWYADDGSLQNDYCLHTEGFDGHSISLLSAHLWSLGVENTILPNSRGHQFIRTYRAGTIRMTELIYPYFPKEMEYKLWQG